MNTPLPAIRPSSLVLLSALALAGTIAPSVQAQDAAPAPAAVALPRMSADEAGKINDALKKLVEQTDPATKAVLDAYPSFKLVNVPVNTALVPVAFGSPTKHDANVALAQKGDIDLLFMGDSITDLWRNTGRGKDVFAKYYGDMKVANFGISSEKTQNVIWRLQNGEGQGFSPKAIMLMIGTNNIGSNTNAEVAEGIGGVVQEMRKDFPNAKILLLGIFPRDLVGTPNRNNVAEINKIIAKLDDQQHVFYLDIGSKFLDANGNFLDGVMWATDIPPLHPAPPGYEIWAQAVKEPLAKLMQ